MRTLHQERYDTLRVKLERAKDSYQEITRSIKKEQNMYLSAIETNMPPEFMRFLQLNLYSPLAELWVPGNLIKTQVEDTTATGSMSVEGDIDSEIFDLVRTVRRNYHSTSAEFQERLKEAAKEVKKATDELGRFEDTIFALIGEGWFQELD